MTKLVFYALAVYSVFYFSEVVFNANIVNLSVGIRWSIAILVASVYTLVLACIFYAIAWILEQIF